ncbi:hypothetical protein HBB16_20430 [Pseudonocardia sp. MCCB 268]|nr:hypothetical protein [Pseudonocardia cytotoxica]
MNKLRSELVVPSSSEPGRGGGRARRRRQVRRDMVAVYRRHAGTRPIAALNAIPGIDVIAPTAPSTCSRAAPG